jgi:lysozyme
MSVREKLRDQLIVDEGLRFSPYKCTAGKWTIAIGRNIDDKGFTSDELFFLGIKEKTKEGILAKLKEKPLSRDDCFYLLENDIDDVFKQLKKNIPWIEAAPDEVKIALSNMCFNLGIGRLLEFKKTLAFLKEGKYLEASREMLRSAWSRQVGERSTRLSNLIKSIR